MKSFHMVALPTHISVFALVKANRGDNAQEDGSRKLHDCVLVKSVDSVDLITSSADFLLILT